MSRTKALIYRFFIIAGFFTYMWWNLVIQILFLEKSQ